MSELKFGNERKLIQQTLEGTFEEILFADLKENTILKLDKETDELKEIPGINTFDEFILAMADPNVQAIERAKMRVDKEFSRENIRRMLLEDGSYTLYLKGSDGCGFHVKYIKVDEEANKAVILRYHSERSTIHSFDIKNDLMVYDVAINEIYTLCMEVNVTQNMYKLLKFNEHMLDMVPLSGNYDRMVQEVAKTVAYGESRNKFIQYSAREYRAEAQLRGDKDITIQFRQKLGDGKYHWVENRTIFVKNPHDKDLHQITLAREIDSEVAHQRELEEAKEKAEIANKSKSAFLFNMSHDIRTPMNAILGFTGLAWEQEDNPERTKEYLEKIMVSGKALVNIINDVLELAQIENNKVIIDEKPVDINVLRKINYDMFKDQIEAKNLQFHEEWQIKNPYIFADSTHLGQIFINLISNAIKYTPEGGSISIHTKQLPGDVPGMCIIEASVIDTGIGMSQEFQKHLFEKFERERSSTISGIQGTGLGIGIAKRLVELMNGTIDVRSKMGQGTVFTVRVPQRLSSKEEFEGVIKKLKTRSGDNFSSFEGKRILMAEDNELNAEIAIEVLTKAGFMVDRVTDGLKCVSAIEKQPSDYYDIVLMDIQMPNMDGYKASTIIRSMDDRTRANIPIVAMTANAFKEDRDKAIESGMNAHVAKPLNVKVLFDTLYKIIQ